MANVLIADDDRLNRLLAREIMERGGHTVSEAASGEEAVSLARQSPPDLIVMDIMMPGMGGISALSILRKEKRMQHIPVMALTALAMLSDKERLLACGFDAYVTKPIKVGDFVGQVQSLLAKHTP